MKHRRILGMLLAATSLPALGAEYLPPEGIALRVLAAQPDVRAAVAQAQATAADGRALAVGGYEWEATLIPQRRTLEAAGSYREWEAQLVRRVRLPGKAGLDRDIGRHADIAASLRVDDATHQAARRLAAAWMGGCAARWWRARRRRSRHWSSRHAMRSPAAWRSAMPPAANSTGWMPKPRRPARMRWRPPPKRFRRDSPCSPASPGYRCRTSRPHCLTPPGCRAGRPTGANSSWHAAMRSESQTRTRCARIAWPPARAPTAGQIRASGCA